MNQIELSNYIRETFKPTARSISMRKPVFGVGINDADYMQQPVVGGSRMTCPAYRAWKAILMRCYDKRFHKKEPSYIGVLMSDEWHSFMAFRAWWVNNYAEGFHIDKDIIGDGSMYSRESCIYIPRWLNAFIIAPEKASNECSTGVSIYTRNSKKFVAQCNNPITGQREFLGYFNCNEDARRAYVKRKIKHADSLKAMMDAIDTRIYNRVIRIIERMQ